MERFFDHHHPRRVFETTKFRVNFYARQMSNDYSDLTESFEEQADDYLYQDEMVMHAKYPLLPVEDGNKLAKVLDARRPRNWIGREHLIPQAWSALDWQEYAGEFEDNVEWFAKKNQTGEIKKKISKTLPALRQLRRAWKIVHRVRPSRELTNR